MAYAQNFSRLQISLHWLTVGFVAFNLLFEDGLKAAQKAYKAGNAASFSDGMMASLHAWSGLIILAMVILRLLLRLVHGVPAPPPGDSKDLNKIASLTVLAFYILLIGMPLTGITAYYLQLFWVGEIHSWGKPFLLALIALHVAAALWHHFYKRNDVLRRMWKPIRSGDAGTGDLP